MTTDGGDTQRIEPDRADEAETTRIEPIDRDGSEEPGRGRLGAGAKLGIILGGLAAILVLLFVLVETVGRDLAEDAASGAVAANLPEGVEGDVEVEIRGFSALWQFVTGRFDEVALSAPDLVVEGVPLAADVVLYGVPVQQGEEIARAEAVVRLDEASVDDIAAAQGVPGGLTLGDDAVSYTDELDLLGFAVGFTVTAEPEAAGDTVLLRAVGAEIEAAGGSLDATGLVDRILGGEPVPICVADRLPEGVEVSAVDVAPGEVEVRLEASDFPLDADAVRTRGTCD
ncbi:LmeA family phospholipid-binding protein [Agromyces arachidis]|uniref:LmeA family phospholipid-binding protein n=1 Tax=Agromyces arachidis TaxID=766966 RepID=UPI004056B1EE